MTDEHDPADEVDTDLIEVAWLMLAHRCTKAEAYRMLDEREAARRAEWGQS